MLARLRNRRAAHTLQRAFSRRDPQLLQQALAAGASAQQPVTQDDGSPLPALDAAVHAGLAEHARLLLQAGASAARPAELLVAAQRHGSRALPLLTTLLQHGLDPNSEAGTALFAALAAEDEATAQLLLSRLLEYGGDLNGCDRHGCSLLEVALKREFSQLCNTLINAGATLPAALDQLPCSDAIKSLARRRAEDVAIRRQLLEP